jgi:hypothetical protein
MFDDDLISTDEYEQAKNYLLISLKDFLKQQVDL